MKEACVFPGSFDPITTGHLDMIHRATRVFDRVIVAVLVNPEKKGFFPVEERLRLIQKACAGIPQVETDAYHGLLVNYLHEKNINVVVRGLRTMADFEMECQMAQLNRGMAPDIDTFFLMTEPHLNPVSSSAVRQVAAFGGPIRGLVPDSILDDVSNAFQRKALNR